MLFERQGWAKSTSKNVAKANIMRFIMRITVMNIVMHAWLHAYIINETLSLFQNTVCTHIVPEQMF